jgi:hypothetical protein
MAERKWMPAWMRDSAFSSAAAVKLSKRRKGADARAEIEVIEKPSSPSTAASTVAAAAPKTEWADGWSWIGGAGRKGVQLSMADVSGLPSSSAAAIKLCRGRAGAGIRRGARCRRWSLRVVEPDVASHTLAEKGAVGRPTASCRDAPSTARRVGPRTGERQRRLRCSRIRSATGWPGMTSKRMPGSSSNFGANAGPADAVERMRCVRPRSRSRRSVDRGRRQAGRSDYPAGCVPPCRQSGFESEGARRRTGPEPPSVDALHLDGVATRAARRIP